MQINKNVLGIIFSENELTSADEPPSKQEVEEFLLSNVGKWLVATIISMQRSAAVDIIAATQMTREQEIVPLDDKIINQQRGSYLVLDNLLTQFNLIIEQPGGNDAKEEK